MSEPHWRALRRVYEALPEQALADRGMSEADLRGLANEIRVAASLESADAAVLALAASAFGLLARTAGGDEAVADDVEAERRAEQLYDVVDGAAVGVLL